MGRARKLVLLDGNSLANRAYYALPPLVTVKGEYTNAIYGFCTMLARVLIDAKPDFIIAAFDTPAPTFRKKLYPEYKAQRKKMPDELAAQFPALKRVLGVMGIAVVEKAGFEADDLIGTLARNAPDLQKIIITGDRDAWQLIDGDTLVWLTRRGITDIDVYDADALRAGVGISPEQVIELKSLMGDASDNIPGVAGVGEKTALALLRDYGTLDGVYARIDKIEGKLREKLSAGRESAYMSKALAAIKTDVPLSVDLKDCGVKFPFSSEVRDLFAELEFKSLIKRDALFTAGATENAKSAVAAPRVKVTEIDGIEDLNVLRGLILNSGCDAAVIVGGDAVRVAVDSGGEYSVKLNRDLLGGGLDLSAVISAFAPVFASTAARKIVFGVKDLAHILAPYGVEIVNAFDLQLAQYVCDSTAPHADAEKFLAAYGGGAAAMLRAERELSATLRGNNLLALYEMEARLSGTLFRMERHGFLIDTAALSELSDKYTAELGILSEKICETAGERFNLNSPKQLAAVLFDRLKLPAPDKKNGAYSTGADILNDLYDAHAVIPLILRYRSVSKLYGTYIDGLRKLLDARDTVHTSFKQTVTSTGRLSSAEPNLQNIPVRTEEGRELRKLFIAAEGNSLVSADYSQIELRLLAHFSGDRGLIEAFRRGEDVHSATAAKVFGVPTERVTESMRRSAKAVNFGVIYGISGFGLAQGLSITRRQAQNYIDAYFEAHPAVREYMNGNVAFAKRNGYISTYTGRMRRIPEIRSPNPALRAFGERAAMNMPLQGSAADLIKRAMIDAEDAFNARGLSARLVLQVHDELIVETPESELEDVKAILRDKMENAAQFDVPLTVEVGSGKNWFQC